MSTPLSQSPTPEWSLSLRILDFAPATHATSRRRASQPEVDEEGLAVLLAEIVRVLLVQSPLEMSPNQSQAPALDSL